MVSSDPIFGTFVILALIILIVSMVLRYFKQPYMTSYILAGLLLGPSVLGFMKDANLISQLGNIGVTLLLFFLGLEISLPKILSEWRIAVLGTGLQILASIGFASLLGIFFSWSFERSLLLGFVITLSSTAVVLKVLEESNELKSKVGQDVISILLVQDLAFIPMMILLNFFGEVKPTTGEITLQIVGGILLIALVGFILKKKQFELPFHDAFKDHEVQVFGALLLCFGLAFITGLFGLSQGLGAFIAGLIVSSAKETHWVHSNLNAFRVFFVALFFVSIGLLMDIEFIRRNAALILILGLSIILLNTFLNACILRAFGRTWTESMYAGSLLSQIGEFSFLLVALGLQNNIIDKFSYDLTVTLISLSLLFTPAWITYISFLINRKIKREEQKKLLDYSRF